MRSLSLLIVVLTLTACGASTPVVSDFNPGPLPLQCDKRCFEPCPALPAIAPDAADGSVSWDVVGEASINDLGALETCDTVHRAACVQCIERGEGAGVIKR